MRKHGLNIKIKLAAIVIEEVRYTLTNILKKGGGGGGEGGFFFF